MGQPTAKLTISLKSELVAEVRRRVGARGLSGFFARAAAHELEREPLAALVDEMNRELGPVSAEARRAAERAWPKR